VDEHEVNVLAGVAFGDFVEFGDQKGVAGDVDAGGGWWVVRGVWVEGRGGEGRGGEEKGLSKG
jgi:hypothetical protein